MTQPKNTEKAYLYDLVFHSLIVKCVVFALFAVLLLQPVGSVFAAEEEADAATQSAETNVSQEPQANNQVDKEEDANDNTEVKPEKSVKKDTENESGVEAEVSDYEAEQTNNSSSTDTPTKSRSTSSEETTPESKKSATTSSSVENDVPTNESSTSTNASADVATTSKSGKTPGEVHGTSTVSTTTPSNTDDGVGTTTTEVISPTPVTESDDPAVSTPPETKSEEEAEDDPDEEPATTTATTSTPVEMSATFINDDNRHQFALEECVGVGGGAYYCQQKDALIGESENEVYVDFDEAGEDKEIYLNWDGEITQITDNHYEDGAPYLDQAAEQVVFHRLIEGRYQIMQYDITNETEIQLTETRENNMQPTQSDGLVVWQRWLTNNWEIAFYENGTTTIITNSEAHDVAPSIRDGNVIWHTTNHLGEKVLSVYDILKGISTQIADPDGGQVENPRFVLVYDTTYENGDVVTKQYDPKTGAVTPIGTDPAPLPAPDIPEPDSTGETRALIQNKTSNPEEELLDLVATSTATSSESDADSATTTISGTDETTLDLTNPDTSTTSEEILPLSEFDVIVEPYKATSSTHTTNRSTSTDSVE